MVILRKQKLVWVSIPKSGTHTMVKILCEQFGGRRINPPFHPRDIPPDCHNFTSFAVVRNPYNRAISIWYHLMFRGLYTPFWHPKMMKLAGVDHPSKVTVGHMIEYLASREWEKEQTLRGALVCVPQCSWLRKTRIDHWCKIENLKEELKEKVCLEIEPISRQFKGEYDRPKLTHEQRRMVESWARVDFDELGYERKG